MQRVHIIAGIGVTGAIVLAAGCASREPVLPSVPDRLARAHALVLRPAALPQPLTVNAAIRRVLDVNGDVKAAAAAVRVARREAGAARDMRDPQLRMSVGDSQVDRTSTSRETERLAGATGSFATSTNSSVSAYTEDRADFQIGVRLYPRNPWQLAARVSSARAGVYAAEAELRAAGLAVAADVKRLFAELRYTEQDMALLEQLVELRRKRVDDTRRVVAQGQGTVLDTSRASYRYLDAVSDRERRRQDADELRAELAGLLAVRSSEIPELADESVVPPERLPSAVTGGLIETSMVRRADLVALAWRTRSAYDAYREERAGRIPWFGHVQFSYRDRTDEGGGTASGAETGLTDGEVTTRDETTDDESDLTEWEIATAITVPIFSWRNEADEVAKAVWQQASQEEAQAIATMRRVLRQGIEDVRRLATQEATFVKETDGVTAELQDTIADSGETSLWPPEDVARMREQLVDTKRLRLEAAHRRELSQITVEAAAGLIPLPATPGAGDGLEQFNPNGSR